MEKFRGWSDCGDEVNWKLQNYSLTLRGQLRLNALKLFERGLVGSEIELSFEGSVTLITVG